MDQALLQFIDMAASGSVDRRLRKPVAPIAAE
jgi:hypothetical protein